MKKIKHITRLPRVVSLLRQVLFICCGLVLPTAHLLTLVYGTEVTSHSLCPHGNYLPTFGCRTRGGQYPTPEPRVGSQDCIGCRTSAVQEITQPECC